MMVLDTQGNKNDSLKAEEREVEGGAEGQENLSLALTQKLMWMLWHTAANTDAYAWANTHLQSDEALHYSNLKTNTHTHISPSHFPGERTLYRYLITRIWQLQSSVAEASVQVVGV